MASEVIEDKLTIKNILFTKALPNYIIPVAPDGHKIFPCTDCGDKYATNISFYIIFKIYSNYFFNFSFPSFFQIFVGV